MHGDAHHETCDDRHEHQRERHPPIVIQPRAVEKVPEKIAHNTATALGSAPSMTPARSAVNRLKLNCVSANLISKVLTAIHSAAITPI